MGRSGGRPAAWTRTKLSCMRAADGTPPIHHDHRLGFRQCRAGLVQRIDALVADAAVTAGQRQHRPTAVGRARLLAGDRPAAASQPVQATPKRPGAVDPGPIGADREGLDAPVHADHRPGDCDRVGAGHLDGQCHIPAVGLPAAAGRQDATAELASRLLGLDPADAGQHHRIQLHADGAGQPEPLGTAALLLELGRPTRRPCLRLRHQLA